MLFTLLSVALLAAGATAQLAQCSPPTPPGGVPSCGIDWINQDPSFRDQEFTLLVDEGQIDAASDPDDPAVRSLEESAQFGCNELSQLSFFANCDPGACPCRALPA